ncbi:MAG: winged helix-turn-helix domain-containing protein [Pseudomonadota bacterium]|nr:winged helix-turn-helix domain-containing protein [Pseudomonadota bacterium]
MHLANGKEYHFLNFQLLPDQARLLRQGVDVPLAPKTLHFLCLLIHAGNAVVSRDRLFDVLWEGRAVSDESLAQVVAQCRRALGDSAAQQKVIKTVPKLGFRFVPELRVVTAVEPTQL